MNIAYSEELGKTLVKISKKDPTLFRAVQKKINQIALLTPEEIDHFKNLRGDLSDQKRVHVGSFVLFFKISDDTLVFNKLEHHDKCY